MVDKQVVDKNKEISAKKTQIDSEIVKVTKKTSKVEIKEAEINSKEAEIEELELEEIKIREEIKAIELEKISVEAEIEEVGIRNSEIRKVTTAQLRVVSDYDFKFPYIEFEKDKEHLFDKNFFDGAVENIPNLKIFINKGVIRIV